MRGKALYLIAALAVLLGTPAAVLGQEPAPAPLGDALAREGEVRLVYHWRYHSGDDPRWAGPELDDTGWELAEPLLPPGSRPHTNWTGTGWFRRHLRVEPALQGKPLVIYLETPGATAVFLDGQPLMDTAGARLSLRAERGAARTAWRVVVLSPRPEHVLAVRHTFSPARRYAREGNLGFYLVIETPETTALRLAAEKRQSTLRATRQGVFTTLPLCLALFHLALFLSSPRAREHLFFTLTMVAWAGIIFLENSAPPAPSREALMVSLILTSAQAGCFFFLLTYYALRTRVFPRPWIVFAAAGAALVGAAFLHPDPRSFTWSWHLYFALVLAEVIRVEVTGRTVERTGTRILLGGFAIVVVAILLQILMQRGFVPFPGWISDPYLLSLVVAAVTTSLFLARNYSQAGRLEVENARKTAEIESARALQVSMLPRTLPEVEGLETSATMLPASEVGGDYYDFRVAPDGSLVVAVGDATGHGVAAGIMVTAVKALFSALGGGESLPAVLVECDRVLREMQVRPLHMCLALARLTPRSVTFCSAAMPPVLIHRAASGEVEELGSGGRPMGSRLAGAWGEHSAPLAPGDTLLFASDGLAEQLDPAGQPFGYERLAEAFRASAGVPAAALVERLLARAAEWRGAREQGDDITLVVIRIRSHR